MCQLEPSSSSHQSLVGESLNFSKYLEVHDLVRVSTDFLLAAIF